MSKQLSKYEDNRRATAETAKTKALIHGESTFTFKYRNATYGVTAKQTSEGMRTRTAIVRDKTKGK
jgi:hypothetical protein